MSTPPTHVGRHRPAACLELRLGLTLTALAEANACVVVVDTSAMDRRHRALMLRADDTTLTGAEPTPSPRDVAGALAAASGWMQEHLTRALSAYREAAAAADDPPGTYPATSAARLRRTADLVAATPATMLGQYEHGRRAA